MSKRKRRIEVEAESLAAGGDGVCRDTEGRVTFVPRAAPGDRLLVSLVQERKQFARGNIVKVLSPGKSRVEPRCELFVAGTCGGCQWQHVDREEQLLAKQRNVEQGLRRSIARGLVCERALDPCPSWNWRRRARFSFWAGGPSVLGFFPQGAKKITDVIECPQLEEGLQQALAAIRAKLMPGLSARGEVSAVLGSDGRSHVSIHGSASRKSVEALAAQSCIAGVSHGNRCTGERFVVVEGGIRASADAFAQASVPGNIALREQVAKALGDLEGLRVLELYAGSGNFTREMGAAREVVAVESHVPETPQTGERVRWEQADAAEYSATCASGKETFDAVLLDPPRSGSRETLESIARLGAERIVYVSCDVATLARDLDVLSGLGYLATHAQPIDLMPQTSQVEVVVLLRRDKA